MMKTTPSPRPDATAHRRPGGAAVQPANPAAATQQRPPLQARSRASLERMLQAARTLMIERGNDDFTLNEVAKRGGVSIGSIYHRFASRDELIRAVQAVVLADLDAYQDALVTRVAAKAENLRMLVTVLIEQLAEAYKDAAPIMRPIMLRASVDPIVAATGKQAYLRLQTRVTQELLRYQAEITQRDPARAAQASFDIVYAALARYLGFGTADIAAGGADWAHLKSDLGAMWAAFLLHPVAESSPRSAHAARSGRAAGAQQSVSQLQHTRTAVGSSPAEPALQK